MSNIKNHNEKIEIKSLFKQIYQHPFLVHSHDQIKKFEEISLPNKRDKIQNERPFNIETYEEYDFLNYDYIYNNNYNNNTNMFKKFDNKNGQINDTNNNQRNTIINQQKSLLKKRGMNTPMVNEDMIEFIRKKQKIKFDENYNKEQDVKNIKEFEERHQKKIQFYKEIGKIDGILDQPLNWEQKQETQRWKNFYHQYEFELGGMKKSEEIKEKDIQCMTEWTYLNDMDINFFMRFMINENIINLKMEQKEIYLMNTFFISTLVKEQMMLDFSKQIEREKKNLGLYIQSKRQQILDNVRQRMFYDPSQQQHIKKMIRWVKEDLFTKNYIILPLNKESHWSTMVVYNFQGLVKQIKQLLNKRREQQQKRQKMSQKIQNVQDEPQQIKNLDHSALKKPQYMSIDSSDNDGEIQSKSQIKKQQADIIDLGESDEDNGEEDFGEDDDDSDDDSDIDMQILDKASQKDQDKHNNNIELSSDQEKQSKELSDNLKKEGKIQDQNINKMQEEINLQSKEDQKMEQEEEKENNQKINGDEEKIQQYNQNQKQHELEKNNQEQEQEHEKEKEQENTQQQNEQFEDEQIDFEKQMKDFLTNSDDKYQPCIIYLDSFQNYDEHYIDGIRCFLEKYVQHQLKNKENYTEEEVADIKITENMLPCYQPMCPRQNNSYDCGIFIIEFIEQFLSDPEYILKLIHSQEGLMNKLNWFPKILTNRKRKMLKDLLYNFKYNNPQQAIQTYKEERQKIIYDQKMQEFDAFDERKHYNYITKLEQYKEIEHLKDTQEYKDQLYKDMLIFYYNTSNNPNFRDPPKMF